MTGSTYAHATDQVAQEAVAALEAQRVRDTVASGDAPELLAWLTFAELAGKYGHHSPAARAYVVALAKPVSRTR
ncbi:hypothetical protein [Piscinibacter defluvii]|uniref:hypothetical protein n=1 Tax=Piscinibacter defluvii TaxID=1796922 RepID=UPI000FDEE5B9|nr:hypothetical protein [Piscinibacter defluvii]